MVPDSKQNPAHRQTSDFEISVLMKKQQQQKTCPKKNSNTALYIYLYSRMICRSHSSTDRDSSVDRKIWCLMQCISPGSHSSAAALYPPPADAVSHLLTSDAWNACRQPLRWSSPEAHAHWWRAAQSVVHSQPRCLVLGRSCWYWGLVLMCCCCVVGCGGWTCCCWLSCPLTNQTTGFSIHTQRQLIMMLWIMAAARVKQSHHLPAWWLTK